MADLTLPTHQKSILFNVETNALSLDPNAPLPPQSTTEHLIRVHSTAITTGELTWAPFVNWPNPHIPCYDVSGTILTSVANSPFKPGDRVFGRVDAGREGTAREFAHILPSEAAIVPEGLGLLEACTVPMSALTAWQALLEHGLLSGSFERVPRLDDKTGEVVGRDVAAGKRVLVLGAAGAVGGFAVQFAKLAGAFVAGTASGSNAAFLRELGVDEVLDYTKISVGEWVGEGKERKFDLVFDCVGQKTMLDGWNGVKGDGTFISVAPGFREPEGEEKKFEGVRKKWFIMDSRGQELEGLGKLVGEGIVRTRVDSVFPLEEFEEAFKRTGTGHAKGKVVFKVGEVE
jgi:NADPH:quinone reductase-like Zn-dependent oxidoreductase